MGEGTKPLNEILRPYHTVGTQYQISVNEAGIIQAQMLAALVDSVGELTLAVKGLQRG